VATRKQDMTAIIEDKRGRILSIGKNDYHKTHRIQYEYAERVGTPHRIYLHAEIDSIIRCRDLSKAHKISIFRYGKNGKPALAKPCPACALAIKEAGIKIVEWTVNEKEN